MILKRVGVLSCGKVLGAIYAALGLVFGLIFSLISVVGTALNRGSDEPAPAIVAWVFGIAAIVFLPVVYGLMGFVGGVFSAWLYNTLGVRLAGGIEVDLEEQGESGVRAVERG